MNNLERNNDRILIHHGIKGQRWGIRRFQNEDGSLTPAGQKRQSNGSDKSQTKGDIKEKKKMSDKQKRILKKLAVSTGIVLGAIGLVKATKAGGNFLIDCMAEGIMQDINKAVRTGEKPDWF